MRELVPHLDADRELKPDLDAALELVGSGELVRRVEERVGPLA